MTPLQRRFGLLQATALNMSNMIGIGPFITIPLLMTALGGPQALLGWLVALVIVIADGMVWAELGAMMPGSGGTYRYLREGFGQKLGRLMAFLFIWQFILSGPLEIASGYIGFANYARYILPDLSRTGAIGLATVVGLVNIALLYRRIDSIGALANRSLERLSCVKCGSVGDSKAMSTALEVLTQQTDEFRNVLHVP